MVTEFRVVSHFDSADASDFGSGFAYGAAVFTRHQQVDIATDLLCRGNRVQGSRGNFVVVV